MTSEQMIRLVALVTLLLIAAAFLFMAALITRLMPVDAAWVGMLALVAFLSPSPLQSGGTTIHNYPPSTTEVKV